MNHTLQFALHNEGQYSLPFYLLDAELHCISIDLLIDHGIHCVQPDESTLLFNSQRDADFAYVLLSSRTDLHIT